MENEPIHTAVLVFDGVQVIDFSGPFEVFGQAGFHVFTVGLDDNTVTSEMGLKIQPSFSLADVSDADIVVVPGGEIDDVVNNQPLLRWLAGRAKHAKVVLSVCNGAFILAEAGLLHGHSATTYYDLIDDLRKAAPDTTVIRNQRLVDNGRIVTAAGLSAGIDGALHVVGKFLGEVRARQVALNLEYNWQPQSNYARAALADCHFHGAFTRNLRLETTAGESVKLVRSEGGRVNWVVAWHLATRRGADEVLRQIDLRLAAGGWNRLRGHGISSSATSEWDFSDEYGRPWRGVAGVITAEAGLCHVTVAVHREDLML